MPLVWVRRPTRTGTGATDTQSILLNPIMTLGRARVGPAGR